jgi:glutaredoxin 2
LLWGPSKRKEEKEIKRNIERKIKKSAKFLGRLEDLTKQLKKDINRRQGVHSTRSLVEIISLSGLRTFVERS